MSTQIKRVYQQPGYTHFEISGLAAGEEVVIPVLRTTSKNGDSTLAVMASVGVVVSTTIEPFDVVHHALNEQPYISSVASKSAKGEDLTPVTSPGSFARVWANSHTMAANEIYEIKQHATAVRIQAASANSFVVIYGDY